MTDKDKNAQSGHTAEEEAQIQHIQTHLPQMAQKLRKSRNETQIESALALFIEASESVQLAVLRILARERTTDAADIALAVNTYTPVKEVRKEARRTLIRLESGNIYPEWELPSVMSLTEAMNTSAFEGDEDEFDDEDDEGVIEHFLESWSEGNYEEAYDTLTTTSPLRGGLSREEWVARRQAWAAEAQPERITIDVAYGLQATLTENQRAALSDSADTLETFWSIELKNVTGTYDLPELPVATQVYSGTGRHWFWTNYVYVVEGDDLRIHSMADRGAELLQLPPTTIEQQLQEVAEEIALASAASGNMQDFDDEDEDDEEREDRDEEDEIDEDEHNGDDELDMEDVAWLVQQSLHYCDVLITKVPEQEATYELATQQSALINEGERAAAYLSLVAERFPAQQGIAFRALGTLCSELALEEDEEVLDSEAYQPDGDEDEAPQFTSRFFPLAEKAFRDAIAANNEVADYLSLANFFIEQNKQLDEVHTLFMQAQTLTSDAKAIAAIESGKASLALAQKKPEEALALYKHAAELQPSMSKIWYMLGELHLSLKQPEEARKMLEQSIELDPATTEAYGELATLYVEQNNDKAALTVLERGRAENPLSVEILSSLAMLHINEGNLREAEEIIEEAEAIDSDMELVQVVRQVITMQKEAQRKQQHSNAPKSNKSNKPKKKK